DGDCHTPLPCEVRKWNDTTSRACCPITARPPAGRGDSIWPSAATRSNDRGREVAAGVVEPRHTVHRRRRERGAAARVAVPDAASAVGRGRAKAPAVRPVNPGLLLGADEGQGEDHRCAPAVSTYFRRQLLRMLAIAASRVAKGDAGQGLPVQALQSLNKAYPAAATTHVCFESVSQITHLHPRRAALLGYVSVTMPLQNCWPLPVS